MWINLNNSSGLYAAYLGATVTPKQGNAGKAQPTLGLQLATADGYNSSQAGMWAEGSVQTEATTEDGCEFPKQGGAKKQQEGILKVEVRENL